MSTYSGDFRKLKFGLSSAETEAVEHPLLLTSGFFRKEEFITPLVESSRFLVLGSKGTGKSAIAEHLRLDALNSPNIFTTRYYLRDFPFRELRQIAAGDPSNKYPSAWSWLIFTLILSSFAKDELLLSDNPDISSAVDILSKLGLLMFGDNLRNLVLASQNKSLKVSLGTVIEGTLGQDQITDKNLFIPSFTSILRNYVLKAGIENSHTIVFDGLDDALSSMHDQKDALAGLIVEASRINLELRSVNKNIKIIVLCRPEVYNELPDANKNKIRQDHGIELKWRPPQLAGLICHRANIQGASIKSLYQLLPEYYGRAETLQVLASHTRWTPRDLVRLVSFIQETSYDGMVTSYSLGTAFKVYSVNYFLPEIKDELSGFYKGEDIQMFLDLLRLLHRRVFLPVELEEEAKRHTESKDLDISGMLRRLFLCGGASNVVRRAKHKLAYRHYSDNGFVDLNNRIALHVALCKAFDINTSLYLKEGQE